jgi:hypothetical protein
MRKLLTFLIALGAVAWVAAIAPAAAQGQPLLGFPPGTFDNIAATTPQPPSTPFSITYVSYNGNNAGGTSYTFASQAIGTADPTRIVAVGITHGINTGTVSSVTIGGVSATQAPGAAQSSGR